MKNMQFSTNKAPYLRNGARSDQKVGADLVSCVLYTTAVARLPLR